jgi:ABC-2 type transport system ATP-binding protein
LTSALAVKLEGVRKTFGATTAVEHLDLGIPAGALYGFIGPNGAGKTTTIRMLMSILFPDSGQLEVLGHGSALEAKDRIGYLPEERGVYKNMRVAAYLKFIARLKGVDEARITPRIASLLDRVGLPDVGRKHCEELSKGMRQKVQFAAAIVNTPELLILDEPFSGLDPVSMRLLRDLIVEEHERGATILFSTHVMPQAEEICDHVIMMHQGRKVLDDPIAAIRGQYDVGTILVDPMTPGAGRTELEDIPGVAQVRERNGSFELLLADDATHSVMMRAVASVLSVARIEIKRPHLEDIFIRVVAGDSAADAEALITALDSPVHEEGEP